MCAADVNTMLPLKTCGPKKINLGPTTEFSGSIVTNSLSLSLLIGRFYESLQLSVK